MKAFLAHWENAVNQAVGEGILYILDVHWHFLKRLTSFRSRIPTFHSLKGLGLFRNHSLI